jgi:beta-galactosidase/beta-glucuronidase
MMVREQWTSLDGPWRFAHDDEDRGLAARWFEPGTAAPYSRDIEVPYPPEAPASGIDDRGLHPVVWYRRTVAHDLVVGDAGAGHGGSRVLVHFGAVDYRAQVWWDGRLVASHVGGQTPFTADLTDVLEDVSEHVLVVRAEDDPHDLHQPRGKQDWREKPHAVWYERTTGIWQPVWVEIVPVQHVADVAWTPDVPAGVVRGEITLAKMPTHEFTLDLTLRLRDEVLAEQSHLVRDRTTMVDIAVPALRNGQDRGRLLWTPEHPVLVDVEVALRDRESRAMVDAVDSYLGLRTVSVGGGAFKLNGQPYYMRSVLNQGYRPDTLLASHGSAELRAEVELTKAMGFNAVRVHQKAEDPRFLFWADCLGLLVWGETASAYEFSPTAVALLMTEWLEMVRRDRSHPSVVAWVPVNESWGLQDISTVPAQQAFARSLADVTRALDPSRPVMSNEGWEHVSSDILGLHDYSLDAEEVRARYLDRESAVDVALAGNGPQGRRPVLDEAQATRFLAGDAPLMITEFGGISMSDDEDSWGYGHAGSVEEYAASLTGLFDALRASSEVVGFCYTQLMDTGQETNGLAYADGKPKLPVEAIAEIVTGAKASGQKEPTTTFGSTD